MGSGINLRGGPKVHVVIKHMMGVSFSSPGNVRGGVTNDFYNTE